MAKLDSQSGFSLVEAMIYVTLVVGITVVFTGFTADIIRGSSKVISIKEVDQGSRLLMAQIGQSIKTATQVNSVTSSILSLNNPALVYSFDSVNKRVTQNGVVISSSSVRITNLVFSQPSANVITVQLSVDQKNPNLPKNQQYHLDLSQSFVPRILLY